MTRGCWIEVGGSFLLLCESSEAGFGIDDDDTQASAHGEPDSVHLVTIDWQRGKWANAKGNYSREHVWHLAGGARLKVANSPTVCQ